MARAPLSVNIHDSHFGIWQDNANDPSFREEVFAPFLKAMVRRGWKVTADPNTLKHYRSLSPSQRIGARGDLRVEIQLSGRVVKIEFWAETWPIANTNGRRYDFGKMARMNYLDRLRVRLEMRRILNWLETIAPVTVKADEPKGLTALQRDYNGKSKDGERIEHGATVWFADAKGRICRGTAYYNLNNMWWVVPSADELRNLSSGEIYCHVPADLRTKKNERQRRGRLEAELATAVRRMDFRRAEVLKEILFGKAQTYLIWARDHQAYYRSNYAGYTTDTIAAGRYTRAEAEAEVRRVPHELEAVGPDGERIKFEKAA
jgi:hypothetical protein